MERRKLNDVFTIPQTIGYVTIKGVIGSGKTREEVILQKSVEINKVRGCVLEWNHRRGELWRIIKESVKNGD